MHTVCQTPAFDRAARDAGMSEAEIERLVVFLSANPDAGVEMQGTGGCRKLRVAGRGKGKSGGYRTITFYSGDDMPVFLITVFSKGERANLTAKERNALKSLSAALVDDYGERSRKTGGVR
ncbi:addiction module toxin RelE [Jiella endophytica]|uniref:Addiction module toxin RelE n=1 Tax=Jiella endophytica TaxID=2558362 RepID=A0A4Y8RVH6_9HYPH|nr:type II toxin-antitoxin system RelE/ParE family toxin [Jiella endophytica]TFF20863.1 addiction module toxin RelE [Jiella endophytica]TFF27837.1 addiction module toxin RelE [Jiella endophytica]